MRHVGDGLHHLEEALLAHLVHHQRQDNGRRKTEQQLQKADRERVSDAAPGVDRIEKAAEVVQAAPGAAQEAARHLVILERDGHAEHRHIVEQDIVGKHRQEHQIQHPVLAHRRAKARFLSQARRLAHEQRPFQNRLWSVYVSSVLNHGLFLKRRDALRGVPSRAAEN